MKTFAFIPGQFNRTYKGIISRYREHDLFLEFLKIIGAFIFLLICTLVYLYFVNMSSTRGYFLKQANQEMTVINFQYEILKTKLFDYKQQNWNTVQASSFKRDVVDVAAEIVKVPNVIQLGFFQDEIGTHN